MPAFAQLAMLCEVHWSSCKGVHQLGSLIACGCAGKQEKITIKNDKGRLSQEEIERMVQEAEEYAEQDKAVKGRIDARNSLETYCYNMKSTVDDKLGDKLGDDDKEKVCCNCCSCLCKILTCRLVVS